MTARIETGLAGYCQSRAAVVGSLLDLRWPLSLALISLGKKQQCFKLDLAVGKGSRGITSTKYQSRGGCNPRASPQAPFKVPLAGVSCAGGPTATRLLG